MFGLLIKIVQHISCDSFKPWHLGRPDYHSSLGRGWRVAFPPSSLLAQGKSLPVGSSVCGNAGNLWMRGWLSVGNNYVIWGVCEWRYSKAWYLGFLHTKQVSHQVWVCDKLFSTQDAPNQQITVEILVNTSKYY